MTQKDDVLAALMQFPEEAATLGQLTNKLLGPGGAAKSWGTKTPDATIRRIVRHHLDIITVSRGVYCTSESPVGREGYKASWAPSQHTISQGNLLELGNMRFQTYVSPQDANKPYSTIFGNSKNVKLGEISTLKKLPNFVPSALPDYVVDDSKTIDVIWFDDSSNMPVAMFEVETSTDGIRSLSKFLALRNFYISFCIVSHRWDRVEKLLKRSEYDSLKDRVKFIEIGELNELQIEGSKKANDLNSKILTN